MDIQIPNIPGADAFLGDLCERFSRDMADKGHPISNCSMGFPDYDVVRIFFTAGNPPHVAIIIAIAISIIIISMAIAGGAYALFLQLVELVAELRKLPERIIKTAVDNPIPAIALMFAVAVFFFGFARK